MTPFCQALTCTLQCYKLKCLHTKKELIIGLNDMNSFGGSDNLHALYKVFEIQKQKKTNDAFQ